jgi:hypothetical protein
MPNWKKVIVSGSDAALNSLTTPAGTINSITASYAITASHALNGGVTQLLAGPNITLSPTTGKGQVTISSTGGGGPFFNTATGSYGSFYDTTTQTNPVANIPRSMSFNTTDITNGVSISGSTSPFNTYIKTENPGVYDIQFSAQVDKTDGGTDDIVIWLRKNGIDLIDTATTLTLPTNNSKVVAAWNWFVNSAANDYYQIIWLSADTDLRLLAETAGGGHPGIPSVIATVNRVDQFLSNTGSFSGSFTGTFTGSLQGTASFASTASFINVTGSNAFVQGGNSFGAQALLGTNDNQNLAFETSGSIRMFVSSSGLIGINKSSSNAQLDINGSTLTSGSATWVLPGNTAGYISPGSDGISIGNNGSGVHIRIRNSNRTSFDQSCGFGSPGFGQSTSDRITVLTGGTTSGQTGLWVGSSANNHIFKVQGDSRVAINKVTATASLDIAGTTVISGSFNTAASGSILTVIGSGSAQPIFTVQGSQGELFSVTDSLSGSLYSVNDISGLPILEVFSDNTVLLGNYQDPMLITTTKLVTTASGAFTLYALPTASYDTAFFEYSIKSGSNARAGSIMAIQSGTSVNFTETTTTDFGSTSGFGLTVQVSGANMLLTGSATTSGWTIKTIVRSI